jgi:crotonobetainyl-CoA:carnitine CoA-transferase CaiB-like acyl-CoA transferase
MKAMDEEDIVQDERFRTNSGRVRHAAILDEIIAHWTSQYALEELMEILTQIGVPAGPVMSAEDIVQDRQVKARALIEHVPGIGHEEVGMLGVVPRLSRHPGHIRWSGGSIGQNTDEVLQEFVQASSEDLIQWREAGIIR